MRAQENERPILLGACVAALIFVPFVAYAYLSPAVYRTTAVVRIKPVKENEVRMPSPLETARKLRDATLDDELIERLARDKSQASIAEAQELRTEFELEAVDGISFNVSFRGSDPVHTQAVCNHLAHRVVQSAPRALTTHAEDEGARSDRIDELMALLSAGPDAGATAPAAAASATQKEELARAGLRAERARLSAQLESAAVPGSDNPYAATDTSPEMLKRRIAEIDRQLAARPKAAAQGSPAAEVDAKFKELVSGLAAPDDHAGAAAPSIVAEVTAEAPLPTTPIEPKRRLVLLIGSLTALGAAGLVVIGRASSRPRRRTSRRAASQTHRITVATAQPQMEPSVVPSVTQVFSPPEPDVPPAPRDMNMSQEPKPAIVPHGVIEVGTAPVPIDGRGGSEIPSPPPPPPPTTQGARASQPPPQQEPRPQASRQPYGPRRVTQVLGSQAHLLTAGDTWSYGQAGDRQQPAQSAESPAPDTVIGGSGFSSPPPAHDAYGSQAPGNAYAGGGYSSSAPPRAVTPVPPHDGGYAGGAYSSSRPPTPTARLIPIDAMARFRPSQGLVPNARRALRDSLLPLLRQPGFVVGVLASDESAQMKPQVAAELALAIASSAQFRLLLVDCDFQSPSLTPLLRVDVPLSAGFSLQLQTHSREAEDVGWSVLRCTPSLDLLAESALRAPDALRGQEFEHCIASIRRNYDIVILNGALLSRFDECQAIAAVSDAVVAVSRRDPQSLVQDIAQRLASRIPIRVEPA